jgi:hypothetical protein
MSNFLSNLIERLLGMQSGAGEGIVWNLEYAWYWPPWATLLAAIVAVVYVVSIYFREGATVSRRLRLTLAGVRLFLLAIVALMIAQLSIGVKRTGLPSVAVVIDDSQSMSVADRYDEKTAEKIHDRMKKADTDRADASRFQLAKTILLERDAEFLRRIADSYKLRTFFLTGPRDASSGEVKTLAEEIRRVEASGEVTRLGAGIRGVLDDLRGTAPAAIVLLSDGVNTDGPPLSEGAASAQRRGVPIFCVGLGSERSVRDLKLADLLVEDAVFVGDVVAFECKMTGSGFQGTKVQVALRAKDKPDVLAKAEVAVGPDDQPQSVRLIYRPTEVGRFEYVVEVEPQPGELQTENNRRSQFVDVRKEQVRVLLADGYPRYEYRYLRNMLERDETVELQTVLQEADLEHAEQDKVALRVFPERKEDIFSYDVIILGDVDPALLDPAVQQNLGEFVDQPGKGGALVLIAGARHMPAAFRDMPLAKLMPFDMNAVPPDDANAEISDGFQVLPTDLGVALPPMQLGDTPEESRAIWDRLPPLYWLMETSELRPGVRVLAEASNRQTADGRKLPVVMLQYAGAGKVLFHAADETWRWRYRAGDVYFARYWIQMIRYLSRSKLAENSQGALLTADRRDYAPGEPVRLRVRFTDERLAPVEDDGVTVVVEQAGRQTQRVQLHRTTSRGAFEGVLSRPAAGAYHAWMAVPQREGVAPAVDFTVAPPAGEFAQIRMDAAALRDAAQTTGGKYYTFETAREILEDLPSGRQVPIETLPSIPLWNRWPVVLAFLLLIVAEWVMRKRRGMV